MTDPRLDGLYLEWLYDQVADSSTTDPSLTYWKLVRQLFGKEFIWLIPNDDNRLEDGKALRYEFVQDVDPDGVDRDWMTMGCSVLELLVGLSKRLAFEAGGEPHFWFWKMIENLGISRCSDDRRLLKTRINQIFDRVMYREYHANGHGGLFPLKRPSKDQTKVELWYQLCAYVLEQSE